MAYEVLLQPRARKEFLALPPDIAKKITQALHTLEQKPRSHQSIKLSGGEGHGLEKETLISSDPQRTRACVVSFE